MFLRVTYDALRILFANPQSANKRHDYRDYNNKMNLKTHIEVPYTS